jgi:nucleolar protein 6
LVCIAQLPSSRPPLTVLPGNLPYSATKETITEHFAKLHPIDIRLRHYKDDKKFMGTCFVEFDRFDRMETCLKKYHHSVFPDAKKKEGRKINVELR